MKAVRSFETSGSKHTTTLIQLGAYNLVSAVSFPVGNVTTVRDLAASSSP